MGFFDRLGNIWRGFLSLWVSDIENRNPEAVYEAAIDERVKKHRELKKAVSGIVYLRNKLSTELETKERDLKDVMRQIPVAIEEGEDEVGKELCEEWRQGRIEVIVIYREWKQEEGVWENKKTVTVWGYISSANLQAGPSTLGIEVHCIRVITQNDAIGTRDYSIDCITGASTIRGGSLGGRTPTPLIPLGMPESDDWGELLNG